MCWDLFLKFHLKMIWIDLVIFGKGCVWFEGLKLANMEQCKSVLAFKSSKFRWQSLIEHVKAIKLWSIFYSDTVRAVCLASWFFCGIMMVWHKTCWCVLQGYVVLQPSDCWRRTLLWNVWVMSGLRIIYLVFVVAGIIMPFRYFIPWFKTNGLNLSLLVDSWHVSNATSGLVWDLTITAAALIFWMTMEVYRRRDYWVLLLCIPATLCIGVSCGLPLFLFLRSRPIA